MPVGSDVCWNSLWLAPTVRPENRAVGRATLAGGPVRRRVHRRDVERPERGRADLEVTRRGGGAGSIPARRIRQTKTAGPARDGRPAEALTEEDRSVTTLPPTDDRPKVVPNPVTISPPRDDRRKVVPSSESISPPKDDRPKVAPNPLVPLHEAIVAAGPGEVWKKVADALTPLLQDWQSYAHKQKWDRLAANLAAATTIAAAMSLLCERGQKYYESDAEPDTR
jgi:hypothetical protein